MPVDRSLSVYVLCVVLLFVHACFVCVRVIWSFTAMLTLGNNVMEPCDLCTK